MPMTISRKGISILTKSPQSRILDPKSPSLLQELTALYQEFLGSDVKAEASAMSNPPAPPSPKTSTNKPKDKSGVNWEIK